MLPNRQGAKRMPLRENVLGNNLLCYMHVGSYPLILGHLLLIRSGIRGKLQKEVVECRNKALVEFIFLHNDGRQLAFTQAGCFSAQC